MRLAAMVLVPSLIVLVPTSLVEAHPPPCLSRLILRRRCPGCGMSRAISCVAHGRFRDALAYNRLVVAVLPLMIYLWMKDVREEWRVCAGRCS